MFGRVRVNTARKEGGLGKMNIPLLADKSMEISRAYGVLKDDEGLSFRGLFIIDRQQNLRQVSYSLNTFKALVSSLSDKPKL